MYFKNTWPNVRHLLRASGHTMTQCTLSSFPSPYSWQPLHCVSPSANIWPLRFVWPVSCPTTPMMQLQILVTHNLRPKTSDVTPVSAESLHNYTESFLPPVFFNICIFTYLWSWYAFQKSRTYLPVPYCTNVTVVHIKTIPRWITDWHEFCWNSKNTLTEGLVASNTNNKEKCILNFPLFCKTKI